jgi:hypothetical protein
MTCHGKYQLIDYIVDLIAAIGVDHIFGVDGTFSVPAFRSTWAKRYPTRRSRMATWP